jgi:SAM-dependent methyltransferase
LYRSSHALLHVSWTEGFPQVLIEAFATGLPVVATDVGGVRAGVADAAILVPPGEPVRAAEALERVASDTELRERLVSAGLERAGQLTQESQVDRLAAFLARAAPDNLLRIGAPVSIGKRLQRRLVPHTRRHQLRALFNRLTWPFFVGRKVGCNCCGGRFRRFRVYATEDGHRSFMCPRCGSLGRHRVDWMYLTTETDALDRPLRLLHIAPEVCLETPLRRLPNVSYLSGDYDSSLAMERVDVRDIQHEDESFDAVICNHVLQLIDDEPAALRELHRVLRAGGWALLQSSVDPSLAETRENEPVSTGDSPDGRYEEVFMRMYGRDYSDRLERAGFSVTVSDFARNLPAAVQAEYGLDPDETIFFCRKSAPDPGKPVSEQAVARDDEAEQRPAEERSVAQ